MEFIQPILNGIKLGIGFIVKFVSFIITFIESLV